MKFLKRANQWSVVLPVGALVIAVVLLVALDIAEGGEAEPPPLLGAIGTPVRGTFTAPTATPVGARPTPRPRPTLAGVSGTAEERDGKRRQDVLLILGAMNQIRDAEGEYPTTGGNIQTLCVYQELDVGCRVKDVLGTVPVDPAGKDAGNGYWIQSDGDSMAVFASLENDISDDERCDIEWVEFEDKVIVCARSP